MRLGIDLDDVLVAFVPRFVRIANDIFGKPEIGMQPVDWEWSNMGLTEEQLGIVWAKIRKTPYFWQELGIMPGVSKDVLQSLDINHELFFITARFPTGGETAKNQSAEWLRWAGVKNPTVIVEHNKGPIVAALKLEAVIDDRPKNLLEIGAALPSCRLYLSEASHNLGYKHNEAESTPYLQRVKNFNEFAQIILKERN